MSSETLLAIMIGALVFAFVMLHRSIRKRARRVLTTRDTLDNEAFSRRYFRGREVQLAADIRAMLAPFITVDVSRVYPDDDLANDLQLGAIEGIGAEDFIANLERLYHLKIPDQDVHHLRTVRQVVSYISRRLQSTGP
jgi:acyl carrier protein